jgi:hypothetical protein
MKCPHCGIHFHDNWDSNPLARGNNFVTTSDSEYGMAYWYYRTAICPRRKDSIIEIAKQINNEVLGHWRQVYPIGANRGPVPKEVPKEIARDYVEACNVLTISAKASAALSRRCLQNILRAHGYKDRDLAREIDLLLNEADPRKAIPLKLRQTVDGIRHFGNFSAHPVDDKTTLQIIDVEPHEVEWCLEIIEDMFEHFYVGPELARNRKAELNAKLRLAGKPPSK